MTTERLYDVSVVESRDLITIATAAQLCGVCEDTIRHWIQRGHIQAIILSSGDVRLNPHVRDDVYRVVTPSVMTPLPKRAPPRCGVYFVQCGEFTKIGFSYDIQRRYLYIAASNPHGTTLSLVVNHGTPLAARQHERHLHKHFAASRHRYEWFRTEPDVAAYIAAKLVRS